VGDLQLSIPPENTSIVSLISFKNEIGESGTSNDILLQSLLDDAESQILAMLGRPVVRAQYIETLPGTDRTRLALTVRPLMRLDAVSYQGESQDLDEFEIDSRGAAFLHRNVGSFGGTKDPNAWEITYTAGWFVDDDDVSGSISVAASDDSFNSLGLFPVHLVPGDFFNSSGFTDAANNGLLHKVVTATTSKITVSSALVDEVAASRVISVSTMPGAIKRAVVLLARDTFKSGSRETGIIEESVAGASTMRWASGVDVRQQSHRSARAILAPYLDL